MGVLYLVIMNLRHSQWYKRQNNIIVILGIIPGPSERPLTVACDGWRVSGFLSHSANLGCSCCYCSFSTDGAIICVMIGK